MIVSDSNNDYITVPNLQDSYGVPTTSVVDRQPVFFEKWP